MKYAFLNDSHFMELLKLYLEFDKIVNKDYHLASKATWDLLCCVPNKGYMLIGAFLDDKLDGFFLGYEKEPNLYYGKAMYVRTRYKYTRPFLAHIIDTIKSLGYTRIAWEIHEEHLESLCKKYDATKIYTSYSLGI